MNLRGRLIQPLRTYKGRFFRFSPLFLYTGKGNMLVMVIYRLSSQSFDLTCAALGIEPAYPAGGGWTSGFASREDALPLLQPFSQALESGFAVGML